MQHVESEDAADKMSNTNTLVSFRCQVEHLKNLKLWQIGVPTQEK